MDDAVSVCRLKGVGDLDPEAEYLRERERPAFDTRRQRLTFEQFEYEVLGLPSRPMSYKPQMCG